MIKLKTVLLVGFVSINTLTHGQGFYGGLGGGYGLGAARSSSQDYKSVDDGTNQTYSYTTRHYSYGQGLNFGMYAGYNIKNGFGVELGFSYLKGAAFDFKTENENTFFNFEFGSTDHSSGKTMRLAPAMRLAFGEKKISGYVKAGPIISVGTMVIKDSEDFSSFFGVTQRDHIITEYSGGICFGAHGTLGLTYMFSKTIGVFAEVAGYYQQWAPKKAVITKYEIDGNNELSSLTTYEKETEYVEEYKYDGNVVDSQPSKSLKIYMPFSSIGFNVGIHFSLGKTE